VKLLGELIAHSASLKASLDENSNIIANLFQNRAEITERLEATHDALAEAQEKTLEGEAKVRELETTCLGLRQQLGDLQQSLETSTARAAALGQEKISALVDVARLSREGDEVRGKLGEAESLVSKLKAELMDKAAASEAAAMQVEQLRSKVSGEEAKTKILGEMWETRAKLEDEVARLTSQLSSANHQVLNQGRNR